MKKRGFTLIELLVVISIIALLLSILLPALGKVKEAGRRIVCLSLLRSFGTANATYAAGNNGYFVPFSNPRLSTSWDERWCENEEFRDILTVSTRVEIKDGGWSDAFLYPRELRCPSQKIINPDEYTAVIEATEGWKVIQSYGLNVEQWKGNGSLNNPSTWWPRGGFYGHRQSKVRMPSSVMMFIDNNYYQARYERSNPKYWRGDNPATDGPGGESIETINLGMTCYRHSGDAGLVYFDGHSDHLSPDEVWDETNSPPPHDISARKAVTLWDTD
jgi:prepilin-type N-terminal cleavage/methylation domain-containing protein